MMNGMQDVTVYVVITIKKNAKRTSDDAVLKAPAGNVEPTKKRKELEKADDVCAEPAKKLERGLRLVLTRFALAAHCVAACTASTLPLRAAPAHFCGSQSANGTMSPAAGSGSAR